MEGADVSSSCNCCCFECMISVRHGQAGISSRGFRYHPRRAEAYKRGKCPGPGCRRRHGKWTSGDFSGRTFSKSNWPRHQSITAGQRCSTRKKASNRHTCTHTYIRVCTQVGAVQPVDRPKSSRLYLCAFASASRRESRTPVRLHTRRGCQTRAPTWSP